MSAVTRPFRWLLIPLAAAYLVGVLWITLLPLPADPRSWCAAHPEVGLALYPLAFVEYIARAVGAGQSWYRTALEVAANIALFIPLGLFVRLLTRRGVASAALIGFGVSIFIEASQLSGLWGTIPCAYRYADVNDVLNNTTGAILGACLVWRRGETLVARRWTGMVLDAAMVAWVVAGLRAMMFAVAYLRVQPWEIFMVEWWLINVAAWGAIFAVPALLGRGSLGEWLAGVRPTWPGSGTWWQRLARALVIPGPWLVATFVGPVIPQVAPMSLVWFIPLVADAVMVPFTQGRGLSGLLSGATYVMVPPSPRGGRSPREPQA